MQFFNDIPSVTSAIDTFMVQSGSTLPANLLAALMSDSMGGLSPVDKVVKFGEIIYAAGTASPTAAQTVACQAIAFATMNGWHGLADAGRGTGITSALQRDLGEPAPAGGWPAISADPKPLQQYWPLNPSYVAPTTSTPATAPVV